jgi:SAM-dependent methyltransferase
MSTTHETFRISAAAAELYESRFVPALFAEWAPCLIDLAGVAPGHVVLDVACGTGIVARRAAARGAQVTGADLNEQMLDVARGIAPEIRWIEADATAVPLADGAFDVVLCQQGLQFMPDPAAALAEMRRVLAPGGRLTVSVWRPSEAYERLARLLDRENAAIARSPFGGGDLRTLVGGHVRIAIKEVRFPSAGEMLRREVACSPMSLAVDEELERAFTAAMRDHTDDDGVVFPIESYVVTAQ